MQVKLGFISVEARQPRTQYCAKEWFIFGELLTDLQKSQNQYKINVLNKLQF